MNSDARHRVMMPSFVLVFVFFLFSYSGFLWRVHTETEILMATTVSSESVQGDVK